MLVSPQPNCTCDDVIMLYDKRQVAARGKLCSSEPDGKQHDGSFRSSSRDPGNTMNMIFRL